MVNMGERRPGVGPGLVDQRDQLSVNVAAGQSGQSQAQPLTPPSSPESGKKINSIQIFTSLFTLYTHHHFQLKYLN